MSRSDVNQTPVSATTTRERNTRHGEPCCTSGTRAFPGRTWPGYRCVYAPLNKYTYTRASYRLLPLSFYLSKYRHPSNKFSNLLRISKFNFQHTREMCTLKYRERVVLDWKNIDLSSTKLRGNRIFL